MMADFTTTDNGTPPSDHLHKKKHMLHVVAWLRENYKLGKNGSVSKNSVYQHYLDMCKEKGLEPWISPMYFGKLVKKAHPTVGYSRKGPRGNSLQHYAHLKRIHPDKQQQQRNNCGYSEQGSEASRTALEEGQQQQMGAILESMDYRYRVPAAQQGHKYAAPNTNVVMGKRVFADEEDLVGGHMYPAASSHYHPPARVLGSPVLSPTTTLMNRPQGRFIVSSSPPSSPSSTSSASSASSHRNMDHHNSYPSQQPPTLFAYPPICPYCHRCLHCYYSDVVPSSPTTAISPPLLNHHSRSMDTSSHGSHHEVTPCEPARAYPPQRVFHDQGSLRSREPPRTPVKRVAQPSDMGP